MNKIMCVHEFIISNLSYMYPATMNGPDYDPYNEILDKFYESEIGRWVKRRSKSIRVLGVADYAFDCNRYQVMAELSETDKTWFLLKWGK